jgi:hypothetical protein
VYLCYGFITEIINSYYEDVKNTLSDFNFNLFTIVEYCLIAFYIRGILQNNNLRKAILISSILFLPIAIFNICSPTYFSDIDSLTNVLECMLLIIFSIFYLFEQMRKPEHLLFYSIPEFWIIVAILIYFSGTLFIDAYAFHHLNHDMAFRQIYSFVNNGFSIVESVLIAVAMVVKNETDKPNIQKFDRTNLDERLNLNR